VTGTFGARDIHLRALVLSVQKGPTGRVPGPAPVERWGKVGAVRIASSATRKLGLSCGPCRNQGQRQRRGDLGGDRDKGRRARARKGDTQGRSGMRGNKRVREASAAADLVNARIGT